MQFKIKTKKQILKTDGNNFHIFIKNNNILYIKVNSQNFQTSEHKNKFPFTDFTLPVSKVVILE